MSLLPALRASAVLSVAWLLASGCTVKTGDSNTDECRLDANVQCTTANTVGYSCDGDLKPSFNCGAGVTEPDGETGYCCTASSSDVCTIDNAAGCTDGSTGYSCAGSVAPNSSDPSLSCGSGVTQPDGEVLYCCIGLTSTSCVADASVAGCTGGSYGYSCTGSDTPAQGNPSLSCSDPAEAKDGSLLYCCIGFSDTAGSCEPDATVAGCSGNSYGFSCTGSDRPEQSRSSLTCSTAIAGANNELLYCCSNN